MRSGMVPAAIMGVAAVISLAIALYVVRDRRRGVGWGSFALMMFGVAFWAVMAGLEAGLSDPEAKLLAAKLSYLGVCSVPTLWLIFAMQYVHHDRWLSRPILALLAVVPVATVILVFTTETHGLVWSSMTLNEETGTMVYGHGWWFWVAVGYSYAAMVAGTAVVLTAAATGRAVYRKQAIAVGVGALVPWVGNLVYVTGHSPWPGVDPAPVAFAVGGALVAWSLARYRLLDLSPIARDMLVESMADAMVVIDPDGRLTAFNPAATRLFGLAPPDLGVPAHRALEAWPQMAWLLVCRARDKAEVWLMPAAGADPARAERHMEIQTTLLHDTTGRVAGSLLLLHDVTDRTLAEVQLKKSEEALVRDITERERLEQENVQLLQAAHRRAEEADTLRQAAAAVAASLQLDIAIERILDEVKRVVPYDAGAVWLAAGDSLVALGMRSAVRDEGGAPEVREHVETPRESTLITAALSQLQGPPREVVERLRPTSVGDFRPDGATIPGSPTEGLRSWLGVPLLVHDRLIGLMELASAHADRFGTDDARLVEAFADQVAVALENARLFEETQRLAITDPLTGLFNRRYFFEQGQREFERAKRYPPKDISAIMLDIDHFKLVNDRHGHAAGDRVLREVAAICLQELRRVDLVARMGGEEFAVLLPETGLEGARQTAERLRLRIEGFSSFGLPQITASMGVAEAGDDCTGLDTLLIWCDRALYTAKEQGRNRVAVFARREGHTAG